jgi:WD40 repeat protein
MEPTFRVHEMSWSPDATVIALWANENRKLVLRNIATGKKIHTLKQPANVADVAWSPDGRTIAVSTWGRPGENQSGVTLWNPSTGIMFRELSSKRPGTWQALWAPDGTKIAAKQRWGDFFSDIEIWNAQTGELLNKFEREFDSNLAWSPDSRLITAGNQTWDVNSWKTVDWLSGPAYPRGRKQWHSTELITSTNSRGVVLLNAHNGEILGKISSILSGNKLSWSPAGGMIASTSAHQLVLWNADTGHADVLYENERGFSGIACSGDGSKIAFHGWGGSIGLCNTSTNDSRIMREPIIPTPPAEVYSEGALDIRWISATTFTTLIEHNYIISVMTCDGATCEEVRITEGDYNKGALSPDGRKLVLGSTHGQKDKLIIWNIEPPRVDREIKSPSRCVDLTWSPNGKYIASKHRDDDVIMIWDSQTGDRLHMCQSNGWGFSWSPDSRWLSGTDDKIYIYDAHNGTLATKIDCEPDPWGRPVTWSPDGRRIASSNRETLIIWPVDL